MARSPGCCGILLATAGLLVVAAFVTDSRAFDLGTIAVGGVACGLYSFAPLLYTSYSDFMVEGAWLGVCTALVPIGATLAAMAGPRPEGVEPAGAGLALIGIGLVLAGLWMAADKDGQTTYWKFGDFGHAVGIFLLVAVVVVALLLAVRAVVPALALGAVVCGVVLWGLSTRRSTTCRLGPGPRAPGGCSSSWV